MTEVQNMKWTHTGTYVPISRPDLTPPNTVYNKISAVSPKREMVVDCGRQRNAINVGQTGPQRTKQATNITSIRRKAFVRILEQPASKALRFRYECEGRLAGSLPGFNSTPEKKTFPTIEVVGYKGRAIVIVSCVTKDPPYKPHPHNLVGKDGCKKGVCTMEISPETMRAVFCNLGIQCVKRKDIEQSLNLREEIRVDPFLTGFQHKYQSASIDLNSVRLCFQVFLENEQGRFTIPLSPVVSDPIYDKKAIADLLICSLCSCSSTVAGGKEIILLCEKVIREDISVRFFEEKDGQVIWEAYGDFRHIDVHKQTAIKFKTPSYQNLYVDHPVKVYIQLKRPSDGVTSEPVPFEYLPLVSDPIILKRKRLENDGDPNVHLMQHYQTQGHQQKYENVEGHQTPNGAIQHYQYYSNIPITTASTTQSTNYNTPITNMSPNCHPNQQELINYNNVQQHWRPDYRQQLMNADIMGVNNFNIDHLLSTPPPLSNPMQWNHPPNEMGYRPIQETPNLVDVSPTVQQSTKKGTQENKDQNGTCPFDVDSDLLMELNSAELERLTLA